MAVEERGAERGDEIARLRERIYGSGAAPSAEDILRLRQLEGRTTGWRGDRNLAELDDAHDERAGVNGRDPGADEDDGRLRRRGLRTFMLCVLVGMACAAGGLGVGLATSDAPTDGDLPELGFAQTDEDLPPGVDLEELGLEPESTRLIATIEGATFYLGLQGNQAPGIRTLCLLEFPDGSEELDSVSCAGGSDDRLEGAVFVSHDQSTVFVVGDSAAVNSPLIPDADPIPISESVTAFRP
tara:strand:+ start:7211 stop:7933 length:723 start_codon:yes stop_codon:yes gene_type:complete